MGRGRKRGSEVHRDSRSISRNQVDLRNRESNLECESMGKTECKKALIASLDVMREECGAEEGSIN